MTENKNNFEMLIQPQEVAQRIQDLVGQMIGYIKSKAATELVVIQVLHSGEFLAHYVASAFSMIVPVRSLTDVETRHEPKEFFNGKHVVIVTGNLTSGHCVYNVVSELQHAQPASLSVACINNNPNVPKLDFTIDAFFNCFSIDEEYVGCGQSSDGWHKGAPCIGLVK